jgi:hypothetical protein
VTTVPRLVLGLVEGQDCPPIGEQVWGKTSLILHKELLGRTCRNIFTGELIRTRKSGADACLRVSDLLGKFPVALLEIR